MQVNGRKRGSVLVPLELTQTHNHSKLQAEVLNKAQEGRVLDSHLTVVKVIVASNGNLVNFITTKKR